MLRAQCLDSSLNLSSATSRPHDLGRVPSTSRDGPAVTAVKQHGGATQTLGLREQQRWLLLAFLSLAVMLPSPGLSPPHQPSCTNFLHFGSVSKFQP